MTVSAGNQIVQIMKNNPDIPDKHISEFLI